MIVLLDSVRSAHNVGSILRTADAVGIKRVYLCGVTPAPTDRFGRINLRVTKVSLGAEQTVAWHMCADVLAQLDALKKQRYQLIALEQAEGAIPLWQQPVISPDQKTALVLGPEVRGLSPQVLQRADTVISIPMRGVKESLNVAVAFGIAVYWLLRPQ